MMIIITIIIIITTNNNNSNNAMFSLNFSSADKGPLVASKAKNMHQR